MCKIPENTLMAPEIKGSSVSGNASAGSFFESQKHITIGPYRSQNILQDSLEPVWLNMDQRTHQQQRVHEKAGEVKTLKIPHDEGTAGLLGSYGSKAEGSFKTQPVMTTFCEP